VTVRLVAPAPAPPRSDAELIAACIAGDGRAQRELFRREYPRVNATVYRLLGSMRDVDDLAQETFVAVFRALSTFRGEAKLSTWIDRIAVRVVFQHIRARKPVVSLEVIAEQAAGGTVEEQAHARAGLRRLYAVLATMTPEARTAFALYAIDGRSISEVASISGTTTVAAKLRIWRARREVTRQAALDPILAEYIATHREEAP
jgi:RNA polymerase sigma factor (sigma-70 family)